ncbi:MAG: hypothetical protein WEB57_08100 [Pseudohongiellaceae bacterium]
MSELTTQISDTEVEVRHTPQSVVINISEQDGETEVLQSGDSATVHVQEPTIALVIGGQTGSDADGVASALGGLSNVTESDRLAGSVLAFDQAAELWKPTNMQRGQIYDGGNF